MRCVFPACDYVADHAVSRNITLFRFPVEESLRAAWLEALGEVGWDFEADSGVCSKHFLTEHFLMTRNGPKLRSDAVPINVQRCRICFARNCKLYSMKDDKPPELSRPSYGLVYETLTGLSIEEGKLPPYVCMKCANRLHKYARFRDKCIRAHTILMNINNENDNITLDTIIDDSRCHIPLSTDIIKNETDSEYMVSDNTCTGELDLMQEDCTYSIKSESIDIVDHEVVFPHIRSTNYKRPSSNLQDDSTVSVKTENDDNIINESIGTVDDLMWSVQCDNAESNVVFQNITSKELHKTNINRALNMDNANGGLQKDNKNRESNKHKMNKDSNFNNNSVEDVFRGEDCSLNAILSSGEEEWGERGAKEISTIRKDLNQTIYDEDRKTEASGGLLLRYTLLTCEICNYQTLNKVQLMRHLKVHSATKVYNCSKCYFLTNSKKSLQFHTQIHCNKKHTCDICEKIFTFKSDLITHLRIHTGEKPYSCNVCTKKFRQYNQLAVHLKVHTGEKPHMCKVCKKTFRQKGQLQNHSRIHSGEKPYSCDVCNKAFIQRGQLQNHLNIHTKEKKYACDTCGKSFYVKGTLQNHMQVHAK